MVCSIEIVSTKEQIKGEVVSVGSKYSIIFNTYSPDSKFESKEFVELVPSGKVHHQIELLLVTLYIYLSSIFTITIYMS